MPPPHYLLALMLTLPTDSAEPPLCDLHRLPPAPVAKDAIAFNRRCHRVLAARAETELHREQWWTEVLSETDQLYYVWDALADAHNESQSVSFRRQSLGRLRELIGPEAYYAGRLPPSVPVWRFPRID
jgi:hypothetical protein